MTVVVAYDIAQDGARARCAALLQAFGDRVQRSVYVCIVDDERLAELKARIGALIDPDSDVVTFYRVCKNCWESSESLGAYVPSELSPYWAVFS